MIPLAISPLIEPELLRRNERIGASRGAADGRYTSFESLRSTCDLRGQVYEPNIGSRISANGFGKMVVEHKLAFMLKRCVE